jgi:uncharacterized protein (TIGR03382 family)
LTPDESASATTESTSDGQSGFEMIAALVAMSAMLVLGARRRGE